MDRVVRNKSIFYSVYYLNRAGIYSHSGFSCSGRSMIELEEISETLYSRPSLLSGLSKLSINNLTKWLVNVARSHSECAEKKTSKRKGRAMMKSRLTVSFTVVEMLQGKIKPKNLSRQVSRWSDCDCGFCTCWTSTCVKDQYLFVKTQFPKGIHIFM